MDHLSPPQALPAVYAQHSVAALYGKMEEVNRRIKNEKAELVLLNGEIERRFGEAVHRKRDEQDKLSTTLDIDDEFKVKGSVSKKVIWDTGICQTIAASMSWDQAHHFFKIKFTVAEAIFKAIEPGTLKDAMTKARTVEYGEPKVELIAKG